MRRPWCRLPRRGPPPSAVSRPAPAAPATAAVRWSRSGRPGLRSPRRLPDRPASSPERLNHVDNGRVAGLTKLFRATARRRLALVLLLVVGGGMITFVLLHHGEPSRAASSETPAAGRVTATDETTASSADRA